MPSNYFPTYYQEFIYTSRYAKWDDGLQRREYWPETVGRYFDFMHGHLAEKHGYELPMYGELEQAVLALEVMPSMRALMTAGPALARDNTAGYNCAFIHIDHPLAFSEALHVLMCGTGQGFSVELKNTSKLPFVPAAFMDVERVIPVADSKEGWAKAYGELIKYLYSGSVPKWDTSAVRKAGERLKTFGGRASGPEPLEELFRFTVAIFEKAAGRQLTPLECHDILCKIGEIVVVGGVRRSAMISLSDLEDGEMAVAKSGEWYLPDAAPWRALANNSVAYDSRPSLPAFLNEWAALIASNSGERGIFNRQGALIAAARSGRRKTQWKDGTAIYFGTNPCSEIVLRGTRPEGEEGGGQFCNLTEVVIRATDTLADLRRKVRLATELGTYQSTLTYFPNLREGWTKNTEEERLLGVSLTGIMDHPVLSGRKSMLQLEDWLAELRQIAVETNARLAAKLGIPASVAITCVKPSGTVSQLVDSASGIHHRHSDYYIRTVRGDNKDPLTQFMKDQGIPSEPCVMKPGTTTVFSFPIKAPLGAVTRTEMSAVDHLNLWLTYQRHWCEHKPSVTISVKDHEWLEVGQFVWKHFEEMSGVSFLPHSDHVYQQAPYQDITQGQYEELKAKMPADIDWTQLQAYEIEDTTTGSQTPACSAGQCELVDIGA